MHKYIYLAIFYTMLLTSFSQDVKVKINSSISPEASKLKSDYQEFLSKKYVANDSMFTNQIVNAIQNGAISEYDKLEKIQEIFREEIIKLKKNDNGRLRDIIMIPMDKSYKERLKDQASGYPGPLWFLYLEVDENEEIRNLCLKFSSPKSVALGSQ